MLTLEQERTGTLLYVEPAAQYFFRKYFIIILALTPLGILIWMDVWRPEGWSLSVPVVVFHLVLIASSLALVLPYRNLFRFKRFRIFENGFVLPGSRTGPSGARFVRFERVETVEAVALPHPSHPRLLYVRLSIRWPDEAGSAATGPAVETTIDAAAIGREPLIRLWREWVARGLASPESLRAVLAAR